MRKYGLIGYPLGHSFSARYFNQKFKEEEIEACYELYQLADIAELEPLLEREPALCGFNVTVPYKLLVIPYLDEVSDEAGRIGAINTVKIDLDGRLIGHNTDCFGFQCSLQPFVHDAPADLKALVLGTGGASRAVQAGLRSLNIPYKVVGRGGKGDLDYRDLDEHQLAHHLLIINTTPIGQYPQVEQAPPLPYQYVGSGHYCYDLVYNPQETLFMKLSASQGARTKNGLEMLHLQAERAWQIWNSAD